MICAPCGRAGDIWATIRDNQYARLTNLGIAVVEMMHRDCEGCDCLHRLAPPPRTKAV